MATTHKEKLKSGTGASLVKAVATESDTAPVAHPDRALWEEIVSQRWAELRSIYKRIFGHLPVCKKCGHKL